MSDHIQMQEVQSSRIKAIGYNADMKTMLVEFHKTERLYRYENVSEDLWQRFSTAPSIGRAFEEMIRHEAEITFERLER